MSGNNKMLLITIFIILLTASGGNAHIMLNLTIPTAVICTSWISSKKLKNNENANLAKYISLLVMLPLLSVVIMMMLMIVQSSVLSEADINKYIIVLIFMASAFVSPWVFIATYASEKKAAKSMNISVGIGTMLFVIITVLVKILTNGIRHKEFWEIAYFTFIGCTLFYVASFALGKFILRSKKNKKPNMLGDNEMSM